MRIRDQYGVQYLFRIRLIDTPRFGVYLHHITGLDPQPIPHDHPWPFKSLVLSGGYSEQVFAPRSPFLVMGGERCLVKTNYWGRGSVHRMGSSLVAHRITGFKPNTWTLILRGRRDKDWGFWHISAEDPVFRGFTNWRDYV